MKPGLGLHVRKDIEAAVPEAKAAIGEGSEEEGPVSKGTRFDKKSKALSS